MDCSGQRELELVALHVDDLRDRHMHVAASRSFALTSVIAMMWPSPS
ncbi:MAG: hypothetical protein AVDCRST_MAG67-4096 [uncultured Solirubrobacteraceae bacterium]|uniref:Uncharacterized protein n=1 Tax=uncultured Solirubrobacteraceae bacterium TaxID=1162706 RepID=A0A6J4TT94_9ACTN|nr:MAG: hypothetical protein AVDCRST_MAG67-4096 [uncultured Solirubrobacteraceae bacterium]